MSSLALQAGVGQPAPYRHFTDRNALFEALAAQGSEELSGLMLDATVQVASDSAWKVMAAVSFGESNMELYRLMFASRLVPAAAAGSDLANFADRAFELLLKAMKLASKSSSEAYLLWAQLHGLVMLRADGLLEQSAIALAKLAVQTR